MSWFTGLLLTYCLAFVLLLDSVYKNIRLLSHQASSYPGSWGQRALKEQYQWTCLSSLIPATVLADKTISSSLVFSLSVLYNQVTNVTMFNVYHGVCDCNCVLKITPETFVLKKALNFHVSVSVGLYTSIGWMGGRWDIGVEGGGKLTPLVKTPPPHNLTHRLAYTHIPSYNCTSFK